MLRRAAGPFWLGHNADPEYPYLFNALSVAMGEQVKHADHPGSTLQWLGAAVIHITHVVAGQATLPADVLDNPELYLHVIHGVLIVILGVVTAITGLVILRQTRSLAAALLFQAVPLISLTLRNALHRASPEPLLIALSILLALGVFLIINRRRDQQGYGPLILVGVATGLAMALKITFLPLMILPLLVLPGLWRRIVYLLISAAAFAALTLNPLMDLPRLFLFSSDLLNRRGYNRPFDRDASHFEAMMDGLALMGRQLWAGEHATALFVVLSFMLTAVLWFLCDRGQSVCRTMLKGLAATNVVIAAQLLLVANSPDARIRYLMPAIPLLGLSAVLLWEALKHGPGQWRKWLGRGLTVALVLVVLICLPGVLREKFDLIRSRQQWTAASEFIRQHELHEHPALNYYRVSDLRHALYLGEVFTRTRFGPKLRQMYPTYYMLGRYTRHLDKNFREKQILLDHILAEHEVFLIHGQSGASLDMPTRNLIDYKIEPLFDNGVEWVWLVRRAGPASP